MSNYTGAGRFANRVLPDMNLVSGEGEHSRQGQLLTLRHGGRKESGMFWGCGEI